MTLPDLQRLGQEFDGGWRDCRIGSCHRHQECMYAPCRVVAPAFDDIDTCATCGEIVCNHSDADYRGWSDPDGLSPVVEGK